MRPAGALSAELSDAVHVHATACVAGVRVTAPDGVEETVTIRIGEQVVGIVTAVVGQNGAAAADRAGRAAGLAGGGRGGRVDPRPDP